MKGNSMSEKLWVSQYMRETESDRRKEILDQAIAEEGLLPDNELRQKLWDVRYPMQDGRRIDTFIRGWITLAFIDNASQGFFAKKRVEKEKEKVRKDWQLQLASEYGEVGEQVLYEEFFNTAKLYMQLCEDDKTYGSVLLGLGHMKKEKLIAKIARDIFKAAYEVPIRYGMDDELALFTRAATDAYYEVYDRQKILLEQMIHGQKEEE